MAQLFNSKQEGNQFFHVRLNERMFITSVANIIFPFDINQFSLLLRTEQPNCKTLHLKEGFRHLVLYAKKEGQPLTDFMLHKYIIKDEQLILVDVEESDLNYLPQIIEAIC